MKPKTVLEAQILDVHHSNPTIIQGVTPWVGSSCWVCGFNVMWSWTFKHGQYRAACRCVAWWLKHDTASEDANRTRAHCGELGGNSLFLAMLSNGDTSTYCSSDDSGVFRANMWPQQNPHHCIRRFSQLVKMTLDACTMHVRGGFRRRSMCFLLQ